MATMDIIKLNGGSPANFLDVGGGATPQAIKQAFDLITSDPKVTAIFVNIFGGIVRCDAIAQGLISVVESMNLRTPIVARLQGTNMELAAKLINESGLKIFSIEDLQSAAEKSVQFSKVVKMARDIDGEHHALKHMIYAKSNANELAQLESNSISVYSFCFEQVSLCTLSPAEFRVSISYFPSLFIINSSTVDFPCEP